jgi:transposase
MGRRTFTVGDVTEILLHWHAGESQSEIAATLGLDRKTVRKYLQPARAEGLHPGRVSLRREDWDAPGMHLVPGGC